MARSTVLVPAVLPLLLAGCIVVPVGDLLRGPTLEEQVLVNGDGFFSKDKIALIQVEGVITGEDAEGLIGAHENTVSEIKARLVRAKNDPDVRGILLRISSPGGEVTACDVIYHELVEFKKTEKLPVVAVIVDEGASGGYYVASAADTILAQPTSIVGSIGVILQTFNIAGLFQKIGVETLAIKSAEKKDILSPFRERTPEEKAILQKVVDDLYQRFLEVVASRTGAPSREEVQKLADGRVVSGAEAVRLKLVDRVGYLQDGLEELKKRADIHRRPTIIHYARPAKSGANIYSLASGVPGAPGRGSIQLSIPSDLLPRARFLYLWQP
jgi:protease-4